MMMFKRDFILHASYLLTIESVSFLMLRQNAGRAKMDGVINIVARIKVKNTVQPVATTQNYHQFSPTLAESVACAHYSFGAPCIFRDSSGSVVCRISWIQQEHHATLRSTSSTAQVSPPDGSSKGGMDTFFRVSTPRYCSATFKELGLRADEMLSIPLHLSWPNTKMGHPEYPTIWIAYFLVLLWLQRGDLRENDA